MPGDKIQIKDGKVYVNDVALQENYINGTYTKDSGDFCNITVPDSKVFVGTMSTGKTTICEKLAKKYNTV